MLQSIPTPTGTRLPRPPRRSGRGLPELTFQWERLPPIASELIALAKRNQAETPLGEPFDPDFDRYYALDRSGACAAWTARSGGALVGYVIWIWSRGLHSRCTTFADADPIYLAPEWRDGMTGLKFIRSSIAAVRELVNPTYVRIEEPGHLGILMRRLRARQIGTVWRL